MSDTPTPRTDHESFHAKPSLGPANGSEVVVPANVASQLERELNAAKERIKELESMLLDMKEEVIAV